MKNKRVPLLSIMIPALLLFLNCPGKVSADDSWRVSSTITVLSEGLVESALPPGLIFSANRQGPYTKPEKSYPSASYLDFQLLGPDGNPRPAELFWRTKGETVRKTLVPDKITMSARRGYTWEASLPEGLKVEKIRIRIAETGAVGKVSVDAQGAFGWVTVARNAAIFPDETGMWTEIHIPSDIYQKLRLSFSGYDKKYQDTPIPVREVAVFGKPSEKSFAEKKIQLPFEISEHPEEVQISGILPGAGLWLKTVGLKTQIPFKGDWKIGYEVYEDGIQTFRMVDSGTASEITESAQQFVIPSDRHWPTRTMILKLRPDEGFLGKIYQLGVLCRVPRIVFFADTPGGYTAMSGTGNRVIVLETPTDFERRIFHQATFSSVHRNDAWQPENLVKSYGIKGGPFEPGGYSWNSEIRLHSEGFYRLVLDMEASLGENPSGIRLVQNETQIPYFWASPEIATILLKPEKHYDEKENRTFWKVTLPKASRFWSALKLTAAGIFERNIAIEIPKAGSLSWRLWQVKNWRGLSDKPTTINFNMQGFPKDETTMRVIMEHGNNRPVDITQFQLEYPQKAVMFIALAPGTIQVYGGNPGAKPGNYDLELVRHHLTGVKPEIVELSQIKERETAGWITGIGQMFGESEWGLYLILTMISIILVVIIARLFPRDLGS
jgi:hypothetical protein